MPRAVKSNGINKYTRLGKNATAIIKFYQSKIKLKQTQHWRFFLHSLPDILVYACMQLHKNKISKLIDKECHILDNMRLVCLTA